MITTIGLWLLRKTGLKGPELLTILVVALAGVVIIKFFNNYETNIEDRVIAEATISSAEAVAQETEQRKEVNLELVSNWLFARDAYRKEQQKIVDTTVLDFLALPEKPQVEVVLIKAVEESSNDNTSEESSYETLNPPTNTTASLSSDQLDVLTRGMWDNYCLALTGTTTSCDEDGFSGTP